MVGVPAEPAPMTIPTDPRARRALMAVGILAFLLLGGLQAVYGPSFAALQVRHGVGLDTVGASVGAHFFGGFVGVIASGLLLTRFGYRSLLLTASLLITSGAAAVALAPVWGVVLAGAATIGLGYGLTVVLINFLFARAFAPRGAAAVNLINGAFGVGAVLWPALVGLVTAALVARAADGLQGVTPVVFGASALVAGGLAVAVIRVPWLPSVVRSGRRERRGRPPVGAALLFAALLFVYVASEVSTSSWSPTHVAAQFDAARGALAASLFWVGMTAGRFLAAFFAHHVRPRDLVLASSGAGLVGLLLAGLPGWALPGYVVAGLALGPVFPTSVVWLQQRFGERAEQVGSLVLAAGNLGPVLGAPAVGLAVAALGPDAIPVVLAAVVGLLLAIVATAWWGERRAEAAGAG
jgi:MFS transporter, FHS family, glucose/mannose:H+ symporter